MMDIGSMVEQDRIPGTPDQQNEVRKLYKSGKIKQAQRLVEEIINPKPKRTLL